MKGKPHPFLEGAYLELARQAINRAGRPLTPKVILELARREGFLPDHLYGGAMHKTLSARLAEHIRRYSSKSIFYRTAPGTFFSHEAASKPGVPEQFRKVHVGNLRAKHIRKEKILVAPRVALNSQIYGEFVPFDEKQFSSIYREICTFVDRRAGVEDDFGTKQFVTFSLVYHQRKLLAFRRGRFTTASERLQGQVSIGFGGHVNDEDFDLFTTGADAFRANAARELREELFLDDIYQFDWQAASNANILGYINVDTGPDGRRDPDGERHIGVILAFAHSTPDIPRKGELSINQLHWIDLDQPLNDLSDFDSWSAPILQGIYRGMIPLG